MTKADKEGQRKAPILRFKGFTNDWEQRKLENLSEHKSGTSIEKYFSSDGLYKVISIGSYGLNNEYIDQGIRAVKNKTTESKLVRSGQLTMVLNDKTANGNLIGRCLLISTDNEFIVNQRTEIIIPGPDLNGNYAYYYLNGPFRSKVKRIAQGGTQIYVNYSSVKKQKINYPIKDEQIKISKLLKIIKKLITLYERKKELLKKFQQGFSDILFKKNPKECVSLGDYFYFNKGKNIGNKDLINNGKYYAIVYGELYTTYNYVISKVFSKTSIKGFKGRKNDLLFPSSSTVPFGTATCSALEIDNIELGNDIIVARPKNTNELDSAFISYQINSKRKILYPIISGTTITHMYSKDLSKIRIWLPNITTQNYISNILQRISHLNILVDKKVNILKEIKKEFLNTMFI